MRTTTIPASESVKSPRDITQEMNRALLEGAQQNNASVRIHFTLPDGSEGCTFGPIVRLAEYAVWVRDDRFKRSLHQSFAEDTASAHAFGVYLRSITNLEVKIPTSDGKSVNYQASTGLGS